MNSINCFATSKITYFKKSRDMASCFRSSFTCLSLFVSLLWSSWMTIFRSSLIFVTWLVSCRSFSTSASSCVRLATALFLSFRNFSVSFRIFALLWILLALSLLLLLGLCFEVLTLNRQQLVQQLICYWWPPPYHTGHFTNELLQPFQFFVFFSNKVPPVRCFAQDGKLFF